MKNSSPNRLRQLFCIFIIAFLTNFVWEELHSSLYEHYQGSAITHTILLRAALFDAFVISVAGIVFLAVPFLKKRPWLIFIPGFLFAVGLEIFALGTSRWAYREAMPIIPLLNVGLTPIIQLGLLGYISLRGALIISQK